MLQAVLLLHLCYKLCYFYLHVTSRVTVTSSMFQDVLLLPLCYKLCIIVTSMLQAMLPPCYKLRYLPVTSCVTSLLLAVLPP